MTKSIERETQPFVQPLFPANNIFFIVFMFLIVIKMIDTKYGRSGQKKIIPENDFFHRRNRDSMAVFNIVQVLFFSQNAILLGIINMIL